MERKEKQTWIARLSDCGLSVERGAGAGGFEPICRHAGIGLRRSRSCSDVVLHVDAIPFSGRS